MPDETAHLFVVRCNHAKPIGGDFGKRWAHIAPSVTSAIKSVPKQRQNPILSRVAVLGVVDKRLDEKGIIGSSGQFTVARAQVGRANKFYAVAAM
jgi:hypothetical protein